MKIWAFESTGDAYDTIQCNDEIRKGDIVLVPSERVVGLADTWPVAPTEACGQLHQATEGQLGQYLLENEMDHNLPEAMKLIVSLGFNLTAELRAQAA